MEWWLVQNIVVVRGEVSINEVINDGNVLLFIGEIHTIIGAGGAEGAIDTSNILKYLWLRVNYRLLEQRLGRISQIFGRMHLGRRFQPVVVEEPQKMKQSNPVWIRMIWAHHKVRIMMML